MRWLEFRRENNMSHVHVSCWLIMCMLLSIALSQSTEAPAVVTLYTSFLDPLPQQPQSGFSVKLFKLRTMHALVDKAKSLQSGSLRMLHVEVPGHDQLSQR